MAGPKEAIYDAEVAPRVQEIIGICQRAGIPIHMAFALDTDMFCTTHIDEIGNGPDTDTIAIKGFRERYEGIAREALGIARQPMFVIATRNKNGDVIQSTVIL